MSQYIPIIGMEVHIELKTASKMFCSCNNDSDETEPNRNICEICTAQPGTLPVPNKQAIAWTVTIGKALGCTIRDLSKFDRKHYFYPDLPKGYQISQYDEPIAEHGQITLALTLEDNPRDMAEIGITRAHLEEDTAKLLHDADGSTFVDFNRAGTPLVEIVTDPDFHSAIEAKMYCQELRTLMRALKVSDADMEKGHMRCEANISVQEAGTFDIVDGIVTPLSGHTLNAKVELKNLNSFKAVEHGIEYEIKRQTALIEKNESWIQQTRGWNDEKGETYLQRKKENADEYRYFPEPDIPPFHPMQIAGVISLPELPQAKRARFHDEYGLSYADARLLTDDGAWANFTEAVMSELYEWIHALPEVPGDTNEIREQKQQKIARLAGGWITSKLAGVLKEKIMTITDISFSPENFAELIALIYTKRVNATNAQKILLIMVGLDVDKDPTHILEEKGWGQVSDENVLATVVDDVIRKNPDQVTQFKNGKDTIIQFLIGMCMKATEGSADPKIVEKILREKLVFPTTI